MLYTVRFDTPRRRDFVHAGDLETVGTEFRNRRLDNGFAFAVGEALWSCHKYASAGER